METEWKEKESVGFDGSFGCFDGKGLMLCDLCAVGARQTRKRIWNFKGKGKQKVICCVRIVWNVEKWIGKKKEWGF